MARRRRDRWRRHLDGRREARARYVVDTRHGWGAFGSFHLSAFALGKEHTWATALRWTRYAETAFFLGVAALILFKGFRDFG